MMIWMIPMLAVEATDLAKANEAMDAIKALEGRWAADTDGDGTLESVVEFEVIANGSAVREIMFPGTEHEMTNMYHLDGTSVRMTHFCAGGNQPSMVAAEVDGEGAIHFAFDRGCNIGETTTYMGDLALTIGEDSIVEAWTSSGPDGAQHHMTFEFARLEPERPTYFVATMSKGPHWDDNVALMDQHGIQDHIEHLEALREAGTLVMAGPWLDTAGGMMIFRASSMDEAHALVASEAVVKAGVVTPSVHQWMVPIHGVDGLKQ
ncbi:MAG: hypothetical protein KDA28_10305 [Phycisphaerales bacterium]|nr:hypothetical protein [Phycisphaerales bacterium]